MAGDVVALSSSQDFDLIPENKPKRDLAPNYLKPSSLSPRHIPVHWTPETKASHLPPDLLHVQDSSVSEAFEGICMPIVFGHYHGPYQIDFKIV